jgi:hypothetical protein
LGIRSFLFAPDFVFDRESGEEWLSDSVDEAMVIAVSRMFSSVGGEYRMTGREKDGDDGKERKGLYQLSHTADKNRSS